MKRIPVILDTDIGTDIDDTWALAMLLNCPEVDVRLILSCTGDTEYRARIIAKFLERVGRADIPVGVGLTFDVKGRDLQRQWVRDYRLDDFPGIVRRDGVDALVEAVMQSEEKPVVLCIGPLPNIAAALRREPGISQRARFVGMHGSVRRGYFGNETISAEYNVVQHLDDCRQVFAADWQMTITPLDTCGIVKLSGADYAAVRDAQNPAMRAVMENYRVWLEAIGKPTQIASEKSSVLFDTVAVYLAFAEEHLEIEELPIVVDDKGFTRIDERGKRIRVATEWRDYDQFKSLLVQRLIE